MPTYAEYFAGLSTEVLRVQYPAPAVLHSVPLLHAVYELLRTPDPGQNPRGAVLFTATPDLASADWLAVGAQVLADLNYPDVGAWIDAAGQESFIRAQDRSSVASHIDPLAPSPGIYSPWVLRGNATGYREMRAQGLNLVTPAGQVRLTLLWRP